MFGATESSPFKTLGLQCRADKAWKAANDKTLERAEREGRTVQAGELLVRVTPHDCRHTYASLMIAAGANAKALSSYMGHSSIQITYDRYGHLMPGNEEEAAGLLDSYLARSAG